MNINPFKRKDKVVKNAPKAEKPKKPKKPKLVDGLPVDTWLKTGRVPTPKNNTFMASFSSIKRGGESNIMSGLFLPNQDVSQLNDQEMLGLTAVELAQGQRRVFEKDGIRIILLGTAIGTVAIYNRYVPLTHEVSNVPAFHAMAGVKVVYGEQEKENVYDLVAPAELMDLFPELGKEENGNVVRHDEKTVLIQSLGEGDLAFALNDLSEAVRIRKYEKTH